MGKVVKAVSGAVKSATKAVSGAVSSVGKTVSKSVKSIGRIGGRMGRGLLRGSTGAFESVLKGDVYGLAKNAVQVASFGSVNTTGDKGIISVDVDKHLAGKMSSSAPIILEEEYTSTQKNRKGLLTQLRQGKGNIGGGSYSETVKNPLGGSSGKTGK